MNTKHMMYFFVIGAMSSYGSLAVAAPDDNADQRALDVTMEVMAEGQGPDDVVETIELPATASPTGVENSATGLATANEARERGREFGQDKASEARQRGEDAREGAADNAAEARLRAQQNMQDNIPTGALDNLPDEVRDNLPKEVRDRVGGAGASGGRPGGS
ncbi:MAG: hypothetical protein WD002_12995 [Pseudomonadales bacterium]